MIKGEGDSFIKLEKISKSFYGVEVIKDVSIDIRRGKVHILCGENGAGKSTLMKILAGLYRIDKGLILINGKKVNINNADEAKRYGIAFIPQELELCPNISVSENIFLNMEFGKYFIDKRKMNIEAEKYINMLGAKIDPDELVEDLSVAKMQIVQIAKALAQKARLIIMDEPCSSLTEDESEKLFKLILDLKSRGVGIIYIDHRIDNFRKIGDRISVLRDGNLVGTLDISNATREIIVQMMVGRKITTNYPKYNTPTKEIKLQVKNLSNKNIKDITFEVYKGEVFGIAGLVGSGRSEIIRAIFGADRIEPGGKVLIDGEQLKRINLLHKIKKGMGYIPEDRKLQSLIVDKTPYFNLSLAYLDKINKGFFVNENAVKEISEEQIGKLKIKVLNKNAPVMEMSGGNQQKIVLGKWLMMENLKILLLDEPTRGVDIGVKQEIYKLINEIAIQGMSIILVTSELSELIGLSDRIAVVNKGRIKKILKRIEFSQERIMYLCV